MRSYLIDEISFLEHDNLDSYLKRTLEPGGLEGVYFLPLPDDLLNPVQREHTTCAPFCCAVVLGKDSLRFEMLIRSRHNLHCDCIAQATEAQRKFIMHFADKMLAEEKISA